MLIDHHVVGGDGPSMVAVAATEDAMTRTILDVTLVAITIIHVVMYVF